MDKFVTKIKNVANKAIDIARVSVPIRHVKSKPKATRKRFKPVLHDGASSFRIENKDEGWFVEYRVHVLDAKQAAAHLSYHRTTMPYVPEARFYGNESKRDVCWQGNFDYPYSGTVKRATGPLPQEMQLVATKAEDVALESLRKWHPDESIRPSFTGSLSNRYATGVKGISGHSDDESALAPGVPIVAYTLLEDPNQPRVLKFRNKRGRHPAHHITLAHNSMLVMGGTCQKEWTHGIDADPAITKARYSDTFRQYRVEWCVVCVV